MQVIPSIDIQDGRCVRLRQGAFDAVTEYAVNPVAQAQRYADAGFDRVHIVDLDGCRQAHPVNAALIRQIAAIPGLAVQAGGGIRARSAVAQYLDCGIDRVVIGSTAIRDPQLACDWIAEFDAQHVVIAADVRIANGVPRPAIDGWQTDTDIDFYGIVALFADFGLRHLLCTDIACDGMLSGPNQALYMDLCKRFPGVGIQASGGVRHRVDLELLERNGAQAAIVGKSLLDGVLTLEEIRSWAPAA